MSYSKRLLSLLLCAMLIMGVVPSFGVHASLDNPVKMDVVIARVTDGNYKAFFPDIVNVPARVYGGAEPNGKLLLAYYKNTLHAPTKASEVKSSSIQLVESTDNGMSWSAPRTFIDQEKLIEWGLSTAEQPIEMRDPNFALLADGTVVFTAWTRRYTSDSYIKTYILTSHDGGTTWSEPTVVPVSADIGFEAKRGDIAVYDDGQVLIPIYGNGNKAVSVLGKYTGTGWEWLAEYPYPTVDGAILSEISFVASGDMTYSFDRESGRVWQSEDRGQNWTQIADEPGSIHQPGLKLLPDGTIFATWAVKNEGGRPVYAKRFYPELGWDATPSQLVFRTDEYSADIADPSGVLLNDGRLFVIYYETNSKTIGGTFCEIGDFDATELATDTGKINIFADDFDSADYTEGSVYSNTTFFNNNLNTDVEGASIATVEKEGQNGYLHLYNNHQASSKYPQIRTTKYNKGDYSVAFDLRYNDLLPLDATTGAIQDVDVYITNADNTYFRIRNEIVSGESVFNLYFSKSSDAPVRLDMNADEWYSVRYTRLGNMFYFKLWQGNTEPTAWTAKYQFEGYTDNGPLRITWLSMKTNSIGGTSVDFDNFAFTRNLKMELPEKIYAITGVDVPLKVDFAPAQTSPSVSWKSSNSSVATVSDGVVTPKAVGETVITATYSGVSAETKVIVTEAGGFSWDFEDVEIGKRPAGLGDWTNADDCHVRVYQDGDRKVLRVLDNNPSKNIISIKQFDRADTAVVTFDYKFINAGYDAETGSRTGVNSFGLLNTSYYSRFGKAYFSVFEDVQGVGKLMYQTIEYIPGNTAHVWTDTGITLNAGEWYSFRIEMITGTDTVKLTVGSKTVDLPVFGLDTVVDRFFITADAASKNEEFMFDNLVVRTNVLPKAYAVTFSGGADSEGIAPTQTGVVPGDTFIMPNSHELTRKGYEFAGWLYGTNDIYQPGDVFTMPDNDVSFTAYWQFASTGEGFFENFETGTAGVQPAGWWSSANSNAIHGHVYDDGGNKVLSIFDQGAQDVNLTKEFGETSTVRVSFKYKSIGFTAGSELIGLLQGAFSNYERKLRLSIEPEADATGTLKTFKTNAGAFVSTGITGIKANEWYDVTIEYVEGSPNATVIFGNKIVFVPKLKDGLVVDRFWVGTSGVTNGEYFIDDLKVDVKIVKDSFAVTYDGAGATGIAPTQEDTEEGSTFTLPENSFAKEGYEFGGWVSGNTIYQPGDSFKMPKEAVAFTALWRYGYFNGEYSEDFASMTSGVPSGWHTTISSNETLSNGVYTDADNKVVRILDNTDSSTLYLYKEFDEEASTARVSFKYKQTSFGEHGNMISLFEKSFWDGYSDGALRKIRLKLKPDTDGTGILYCYLASAGYDYAPSVIKGIELNKWYDVSIEVVEGSQTATIIFGDKVMTMPIYGTGSLVSTLVFSSGESGANKCEFFVDDVQILTRVPKDFFTVTYVGGDGSIGTAPTQDSVEAGMKFKLPENSFEKTNYKFGGWLLGNTLYQPGETCTMPDSAVTFTAYWLLDTYNGGFEDKFDNLDAGYVPSSAGWISNSGSTDNYYGRVHSVDNGNILRMHDSDTSVAYNLGKEFEGSSNARLSFKYRQVAFGASGNEIALFEGFYAGLGNGNYKKVRLKIAPDGNGTGTLKYFDSVSTWDFKASEITGIELNKWYDVSVEVTEGSSTATVIFDNKIITVPVRNNSFVSTVALNTGNAADTCTFDLDDIKVETLLPRESFAVTYAGGEGATGKAPVQEDTEKGMNFVLPANTFTKTGYEFIGWLCEGKLYRAGESFTMPAKAVSFTAYWMIGSYNGGFSENFNGMTEGLAPNPQEWVTYSNTDTLHARVYSDDGNKVLRVLDGGAGTANVARLFEKSSTSRISFKFKNISYGTGCNLFGLLEGDFTNYKYKLRLAVMPASDGSGTLKYYKGGWKETGITGIISEKWHDVTIELLDGATVATVIFGDQIASVPIEGIDTVVSNLWFGSGGGGSYGDTFYIDDIYVKTRRDPLETYYVSSTGNDSNDGATLQTSLGSLAAVYNYVDTSVYPVVNVYIDGKISEGTVTKTEYPGLTLNILPANASGDEITGLTAVSNINLGNITVGKLSMVSGIVTNNSACVNNLIIDNVATEAQFNQLGGAVDRITQNTDTTANKVVFFIGAEKTLPSVEDVVASQLSVIRAPVMKNDDKTVAFPVAPTDKVGVFETYSGSDYQFGWGKVNYTCYAQDDDVIFYSNEDTGYKLTVDEAGDYQLMVVGTESYQPEGAKATYYFTTNTLTRNGNGWTESATVPGETNDFYGNRVVLFPLSPDACAWNADNGTGKITAVVAENYSFDGVTYTAKKAHTADFANFVAPAVPEGRYFVGWKNEDGTFAEDTAALSAGDVLTAQFESFDLAVGADLSVIGAQIRIKDAENDLRFVSRVSKEFLSELGITEFDGQNVKFGTVLLPSTYLAYDEFGIGYTDTKGNTTAKVPAVKTFAIDETSVTFTAVLTGLGAANEFTDYVARPYVEYTDMNGATRTVYGESYDTSIWEIADYALRLDADGTQPVNEYVKLSLVEIHDAVEAYVQSAKDGAVITRGGEPEFETEDTGRHTDVHLADGAYSDATEQQFAHGKVFYNTNAGTVVREIRISGGSETTTIGVVADTHIDVVDYNGQDKYDAEYMLRAQTTGNYNSERVDNSFINAVKLAGLSDRIVLAGDVVDYDSEASSAFVNAVTDKYSNVVTTDGYNSGVVNDVMLISMDNASGRYTDEQLAAFESDIAAAKAAGLTVLVFQDIPLATGYSADVLVKPVENFGDNTDGINYYTSGNAADGSKYNFGYNFAAANDSVNDAMYTLIATSSDVIKGIFCGYFHQSSYVEIPARDADGNIDSSKPAVAQYGMAPASYTDAATNGGRADKGTMVRIVVTPEN